MSKTLFLSPPSFDGFDGGAGSRYQARREVTSFWYPTWLAQPAALVPDAKLLDCPPHDIDIKRCLEEAKGYDHVIIHTSTPSLKNDCKVAEAIKQNRPETKIGFVGAHAAVLPTETLQARSVTSASSSSSLARCSRSTQSRFGLPTRTPATCVMRSKSANRHGSCSK